MIKHIWDKSKEGKSFKENFKPWNLHPTEFNLHNVHVWIEKNDKQTLNCFYDIIKERNELQHISASSKLTSNENIENKNAFTDFVQTNLDNPKFKNKFVAFVNGIFQDVGDKRNALIEKMYDKFGNVDMYVDKITAQKKVILIDTPEFN